MFGWVSVSVAHLRQKRVSLCGLERQMERYCYILGFPSLSSSFQDVSFEKKGSFLPNEHFAVLENRNQTIYALFWTAYNLSIDGFRGSKIVKYAVGLLRTSSSGTISSSSWYRELCALGPVHMVKKGHKYVTLLQINVPRVMILSQKLGTFIWQGDIYLTVGDIYLRWRVIHLTRRDIYLMVRDFYFGKGHNFVTNY